MVTGWNSESKGSKFNEAYTANADIFTTAISPTAGNVPCVFRIMATFSASGILTVRRTLSGTTVSGNLNAGAPLTASAIYIFDIIVDQSETINLRYSVNATINKISVIEIEGGT
jgi:hypothetical protein